MKFRFFHYENYMREMDLTTFNFDLITNESN